MLFGQCPNGGGDKLKGASLKPSVLNDSIHIVESDQCSVNMWNSVDSSCEIWMHGAQNANSANPAPKQKTKTFLVAIFYQKFSFEFQNKKHNIFLAIPASNHYSHHINS